MEPLKYINKLKVYIKNLIQNKKYNKALTYISLCSNLLYNYNQYYYDDDLENYITELDKTNNINFSNQVRLILSAYIRKVKEGTENAEGI